MSLRLAPYAACPSPRGRRIESPQLLEEGMTPRGLLHRVLGPSVRIAILPFLLIGGSATSLAQESPEEEGIYREIGYVPMQDGVKLAYIAYRPSKEGRFPVVVNYDAYQSGGYSISKQLFLDDRTWIVDLIRHGYAVVGANVRGSGCSEGESFTILDPQQTRDGVALIEWIGSRPWSNGNVGMIGNSYPGHMQILVSAEQPRYLKALAAGGLTADLYKEAFRPGGMFNVSFAAFWGLKAQPWIERLGAKVRIEMGDSECQVRLGKRPLNRTFYNVAEHPLHDEFWKVRATENRVDQVEIPTLIIQAWQDHETTMGGARLFQRLKGPKRMILQNGGHEVYETPISRAEVRRWMDRWLKGEKNGVDEEPPVTVWFETHKVDGQMKPGWIETFGDWPVPETEWLRLYLTSDGGLKEEPLTATESGKRSYVFPMGTELIGDNIMFANPPSPMGSLLYRSAPMSDDTTILGSIQFTFFVSSEQWDTDFMVAIHDLSPRGETLFVQRAFLRASHRAVDPERSSEHWVFHPHENVEKLDPGRIYKIQMSLPEVGHMFRRGHSLELAVLAPSASPAPDWGPMPLDLPGVNTIYHSAQHPSRLVIPIVPGLKPKAPALECGALGVELFQPCRPALPESLSAARMH